MNKYPRRIAAAHRGVFVNDTDDDVEWKEPKRRARATPPLMPQQNTIAFPFRSKTKFIIDKPLFSEIEIKPKIPDFRLKPLLRLQKPYFSNEFDSWEIDIMYKDDVLFFIAININTKVIFIRRIRDRSEHEILSTMMEFTSKWSVKNVRGDSERGWAKSRRLNQFFKNNGITTFFSNSKFTNHSRVVDRVIRTFRDAFGDHKWTQHNIEQMVEIYNNTPHSAFGNIYSPIQMQVDLEAQGIYIRAHQDRLRHQRRLQNEEGLLSYQKGNILMIHLDLSRTRHGYQKRRRTFDHIASFIRYKNNNAVVKLLSDPMRDEVVEIPIHFTKKVADSFESLDDKFFRQFRIRRSQMFL